jgi:hypothetical protein
VTVTVTGEARACPQIRRAESAICQAGPAGPSPHHDRWRAGHVTPTPGPSRSRARPALKSESAICRPGLRALAGTPRRRTRAAGAPRAVTDGPSRDRAVTRTTGTVTVFGCKLSLVSTLVISDAHPLGRPGQAAATVTVTAVR